MDLEFVKLCEFGWSIGWKWRTSDRVKYTTQVEDIPSPWSLYRGYVVVLVPVVFQVLFFTRSLGDCYLKRLS